MQSLPGFREMYPEDAVRRSAIVGVWREVARAYGFDEYDGPTLEPLELYAKKNAGGAEILGQLYRFEDGGARAVALRPEMTPTLARMVAAKERNYRKPMKWFSCGNFFRFERQQRGRLREFMQFNCDLIGDASAAADAELVALAIGTMKAFGFSENDIVVRISHRGAWSRFLAERSVQDSAAVLQVVDKLDREPADSLARKLEGTGVSLDDLCTFIASGSPPELEPVLADLSARGLGGFVETDLSIVRGLAYYTGLVFEIFDRKKEFRAIAGGGRYDGLIRDLSDARADLPAVGFGMGDVVLAHVIEATAAAKANLNARIAAEQSCQAYIVIADETRRSEALRLVQDLRDAGVRVDFPLAAVRVGKQFQTAEGLGARYALVVGEEWPSIKVKTLATREEVTQTRKETLALFSKKTTS